MASLSLFGRPTVGGRTVDVARASHWTPRGGDGGGASTSMAGGDDSGGQGLMDQKNNGKNSDFTMVKYG